MHESVATAIYRGYERKIHGFDHEAFNRRLPAKRAAWLRAVLRNIKGLPGLVAFEPRLHGQGKQAEATVFGFSHETDACGRSGWHGFVMSLSSREFGFEIRDTPVLLTHHLVQRTMQRLGVSDPAAAIRGLEKTAYIAMWLDPQSADDNPLLPAKGGAVVAVPDRSDSSRWALVTFIDNAKLSDSQRQKIRFWFEKAEKLSRTPTHERRAERACA